MTNPILRSQYEKEMLKYTDLPEAKVKELEALADEFTQFQFKQIQLQNATIDAQMQQMQQPQQQLQMGGQEQMMGARELARQPGLGQLPGNAGIAGGETSANNTPNSAPSDFVQR